MFQYHNGCLKKGLGLAGFVAMIFCIYIFHWTGDEGTTWLVQGLTRLTTRTFTTHVYNSSGDAATSTRHHTTTPLHVANVSLQGVLPTEAGAALSTAIFQNNSVSKTTVSTAQTVVEDDPVVRRYHLKLLTCTKALQSKQGKTPDEMLDVMRSIAADIFDPNNKNITLLDNYVDPCWASVQKRGNRSTGGRADSIHCLPFLYIAGMPKSGTTDLYRRLTKHPKVIAGKTKEPEWWARTSLGWWSQNQRQKLFEEYVDMFEGASSTIQFILDSKDKNFHPAVTLDASPSTLWEIDRWPLYPGNERSMEPNVTLAEIIHSFTPAAKIVIILRNPVDRLYSHYFHRSKVAGYLGTLQDFHQRVVFGVNALKSCAETRTMRACMYDSCLNHLDTGIARVAMRAGIYHVYISDWLRVFPRDQIKIVRHEDYAKDEMSVLNEIFNFLGVGSMPENRGNNLKAADNIANLRDARYRKLGPMPQETRSVLAEFYAPFNEKLAELLEDNRFLYPS